MQLCVHDRLSTRQLDRQIDSALYERNAVGSPKLSAVLREIAPQAEQIFRDQYVMEFIGGKEYEHENSMKAALVKQMKKYFLQLQTFPNLFLQLVATTVPTGDKSRQLPQKLTCHNDLFYLFFLKSSLVSKIICIFAPNI